MEDTQKELERLEQELLVEEKSDIDKEVDEILLDEELLREVKPADAEPAFDDPEKIHEPVEPMVYRNFSNDYGKDQQGDTENEQKKKDKVVIGLMIAVSALCLGIMGILLYWLLAFLN